MTRKRLVLAAAIIAIVGLAAAGTNAYTTAEAHTTNVITTGAVNITLNDAIVGGEQVSAGWELAGVMPGVDVEKTVSVTNVGPGDAWVRVKVDTAITPGENVKPKEKLNPGMVTFDVGEGWIPGDDGCYYYSLPMKAGETTPNLFSLVSFSPKMDNDYQGCTVTMTVSAQAVQVKNNDNGGDLTELTEESFSQVQGWPAES